MKIYVQISLKNKQQQKHMSKQNVCSDFIEKNNHQKPVQIKGVNIIWQLSQICVTREATVAAF